MLLSFKKINPIYWVVLCSLLALIPFIILTWSLATTGVDTVSNDYMQFIAMANRVVHNGFDWPHYFQDTLYTKIHSYAFLFPVRLIILDLTHLSIVAEVYLGLALAVIKVVLLFLFLSLYSRRLSPLRYLLLPFLSALVFSPSQISTFSYGETTLQYGFIDLFILLELMILLARPKNPLTLVGMVIFGVLASGSGGGGLMAWPVFFTAILITDLHSWKKYLAWLIGFSLSIWPYLAYSTFSPLNGFPSAFHVPSITYLFTSLGLPMANNINYGIQEHTQALISGMIGCALCIIGFSMLFLSPAKTRQAFPALLVLVWGIFNSIEVGFSRALLAPWYTSAFILFWIGLLGIFIVLINSDTTTTRESLVRPVNLKISGILCLGVMGAIFIYSNHSFADKSFYLYSRSPVSAACLRGYQTAPTYCEGLVFQWKIGSYVNLTGLAKILKENNWSIFGPREEWTLQGDYILGNVKITTNQVRSIPHWVYGSNDAPAQWDDYRHLNLLINQNQSVDWQVDLPSDLNSAAFEMGLSLADPAQCAGQQVRVIAEGKSGDQQTLYENNQLCKLKGVANIHLDMQPLAGQSITLKIQQTGANPAQSAVRLHYPRILLSINQINSQDGAASNEIHPMNININASFWPANPLFSTIHFPGDPGWSFRDASLEAGTLLYVSGLNPQVHYTTN